MMRISTDRPAATPERALAASVLYQAHHDLVCDISTVLEGPNKHGEVRQRRKDKSSALHFFFSKSEQPKLVFWCWFLDLNVDALREGIRERM